MSSFLLVKSSIADLIFLDLMEIFHYWKPDAISPFDAVVASLYSKIFDIQAS